MFKIFKRNPSTESEIIYKNYKNKLTHVIRQSKKTYFKDKFDLYKNYCRKTWSTLNKVIKSKDNKSVINDKFITLDGTHCTDKREIVDNFNNYFINIGHRLNVNLTQTGNDRTQFIFLNASSFFCIPTYP